MWKKILRMAEDPGFNRTFLRYFYMYSSRQGPFSGLRRKNTPFEIVHPFTETSLETYYFLGHPEFSGLFFEALCERDADELIIWADGDDLTWFEIVTMDERTLYGPLSEHLDPFICYMGRGLFQFVAQFGESPLSRRYINYDSNRRILRWSRNRTRRIDPYFTVTNQNESNEIVEDSRADPGA